MQALEQHMAAQFKTEVGDSEKGPGAFFHASMIQAGSDEVKGGIKEDPDQVDEVPVQACHFNGVVEVRGKMSLARAPPKRGQGDHAPDDVGAVEAGQKVVKA